MNLLRLPEFCASLMMVILLLSGCQTATGGKTASPAIQQPDVAPSPLTELAQTDTEQLHKIIKDYILANPSIINQALQISRLRQQTRSQKSAAELLQTRYEDLYNDELTLSNEVENPDITVIEFFDYRCGFCKKAHPVVKALLAGDPKIKFIYKEFPILGPVSDTASRATIAARKQGKYLELHHKIFSTPGRLTEKRLMQDAATIGIDIKQLKDDMLAPEVDDLIIRNKVMAKGLKITGTPTFIVGNQIIQGFVNLDKMKQAVATAREIEKNATKKN